ncbi:hypothetical protein [Pararhizobium sp.]|uniref:hypothetical protein n=1 Tax=Pararhizobium sp. TaxID=1977563 RepID=UPI003D152DBB
MTNRFIAVNTTTGIVIGVFIGNPDVPGLLFVPATPQTQPVCAGFRYSDGKFIKSAEPFDRQNRFIGVGDQTPDTQPEVV